MSEQIDREKLKTDLRERAAIAAMQGIVHDFPLRQTGGPQMAAMIAVQCADALIAELRKEVTR